jgi:hypothetical protein
MPFKIKCGTSEQPNLITMAKKGVMIDKIGLSQGFKAKTWIKFRFTSIVVEDKGPHDLGVYYHLA